MALGVTPGRVTFDFEPGAEKTVDFTILNSDKRNIDLAVFTQGEFNASISLSEVSFRMLSSEYEKKIKYKFRMPETLSPGLHTTEVVVLQLPEKSGSGDTFIGATVGVITQLYVYVPYPGKYAEAALNVIDSDSGGKVTFAIPIVSRGKLDISRVRATIDIYTSLNEKVATVSSNTISLASGERGEVSAEWTADAPPGSYRAVATVLYDEQTLTLEKQFAVGTPLLELQNVEVNDFSLGEIAKFEMLVESKWSQPIIGAYAQMLIYNSAGEVMADFKSATYDVPSFSKAMMVSFWDTEGVRKGTYPASLFLRYNQQSVQRDFKLEVSDNNINVIGIGYVISKDARQSGGTSGTLVVVLASAIGVLVLINIVWFLVLRKKLKEGKK